VAVVLHIRYPEVLFVSFLPKAFSPMDPPETSRKGAKRPRNLFSVILNLVRDDRKKHIQLKELKMKIKAIITGVTGMAGEGVLHTCLNHPDLESVLIINK